VPAHFSDRRSTVALAAAFLLAAVLFTAWPGTDIAFSRLFYTPRVGFSMDGIPALATLRRWIWGLSEGMVALATTGLILSAVRRNLRGAGGRLWTFVLSLYLLGPGLLVNGILKAHWGRARPAEISDFGGVFTFSPALEPIGHCLSNCSFVSGEGAAAVAFAVSVLVLLSAVRDRIPAGVYVAGAASAATVGFVGSALRVITGRHFLSDTVFAAIFVLAIALILRRLLGVAAPPDGIDAGLDSR
jgi:lipid A 4'-phosphatase